MPPRPHLPHPRPRPHFRGRVYGGAYPYVVNPEPYVIEVERSEVLMPWRVTNTTSVGTNVVASGRDQRAVIAAFQKTNPPGFNNNVRLEHWDGSSWVVVEAKAVTNGRSMNGLGEPAPVSGHYWLFVMGLGALGYYGWKKYEENRQG